MPLSRAWGSLDGEADMDTEECTGSGWYDVLIQLGWAQAITWTLCLFFFLLFWYLNNRELIRAGREPVPISDVAKAAKDYAKGLGRPLYKQWGRAFGQAEEDEDQEV